MEFQILPYVACPSSSLTGAQLQRLLALPSPTPWLVNFREMPAGPVKCFQF